MTRMGALAARAAATLTLGLAAAVTLTGCCYYELRDVCDECSLNVRNGYSARMAWHRCGDAYDDHPHAKQFKHGFIDGYAAVGGGADGCPPPMPPRCYWSCCNSGCEGQNKVNAYFDGYARGAVAAESDGLAASSRIAFHKPACGAGCPVPGYGVGPGPLAPTPAGNVSIPGPLVGPGSPPPPAPPSVAPTAPADGAYDGTDEGGLYYE